MAAHTPTQKAWIISKLAAFCTPRDIATAFAARFEDTACTEIDVLACDPRVAVLSPGLLALFKNERERVISDPTYATYASKEARLIVLSNVVDRYLSNNDLPNARIVIRQIAEEQGDVGGGKKCEVPDTNIEPVTEIKRTVVMPAPVADGDK